MKTIINIIAKITGVSKVISAINGKKTYIGAVASILIGLGEVLAKLSVAADTASMLEIAKGLPNDPATLMLVGGFTALGIGHKIDKAEVKKDE